MPLSEIEKLDALAQERGITIYNICHRNAGWGVQWLEIEGPNWKNGLVVYNYYPTIAEMIAVETARLSKL